MRLSSIKLENIAGLDLIEVTDLSDVVVLAGPNGVGKTRILQALIGFFRKPRSGTGIQLLVDSTSEQERTAWGKSRLEMSSNEDATKLRTTLQRPQRRDRYRSTVLN